MKTNKNPHDLPVVLVKFLGGGGSKPYAYLVPPWINVDLYDKVIIEARDTISLGEVVSIHPSSTAASYASAMIISVVDLAKHQADKNHLNEEY